ncbi:MAG TPA: signal peptidase I [Pyrinomonadaceae bacterium]|jgi:signal peptidase I|nr:signal peptidase I [Pyrinomonadaceae bacterium]
MNHKVILGLVCCSFVSACFLLGARTVKFQGTSMLPSIKDGDLLRVVGLNSESRRQLSRGDIVVFKYPPDPTKSYIKRLIGLPGDRIEIINGKVWLNDSKLTESYLDRRFNLSARSQPPITVPARAYFVMGDNRDNSSDSRFWGTVPEDLIYAKVVGK